MFTLSATDGLARAGVVAMRHTHMPTPGPLLYTRRGGCMYLTPDMMETLRPQAQLLQVNVMQFMTSPDADTLRQFGSSLHHYLGVPAWGLVAVNRDPTLAEYGARHSTDKAVFALNHSGSQQVNPERYMEVVAAMQPEAYVALADEVPAGTRRKKIGTSVDRTLQWLNECLARHQQLTEAHPQQGQQQQQQQPGAGEGTNGQAPAADAAPQQQASSSGQEGALAGGAAPWRPHLLAPVMGCDCAEERARSARAAAELAGVSGYALCGFGMGEASEAQPALMRAAVEQLPAGKPRLVLGLGSPDEVVAAVGEGVDLFDCGYPFHATVGGYALAFPTTPEDTAGVESQAAAAAGAGVRPRGAPDAAEGAEGPGSSGRADAAAFDGTKLNLWSLAFRHDKGPLVPGCGCFACANHTRAYVHHLLHTNEMLASVLLETHNTHWWLRFFGGMQGAIEGGRWERYAAWWRQQRTLHWHEA